MTPPADIEWAGLIWTWVDNATYDIVALPAFRQTRSALVDFGLDQGETPFDGMDTYWPKFMIDYVMAPADDLAAQHFPEPALGWFLPRPGIRGYELIKILDLIRIVQQERTVAQRTINSIVSHRRLYRHPGPAWEAAGAFMAIRGMAATERQLVAYAVQDNPAVRKQRVKDLRDQFRTLRISERQAMQSHRDFVNELRMRRDSTR